jgi:hypothetical protein
MVYPLAEDSDFRGSDDSRRRSSQLDVHFDSVSASYEASVDNLCLHWFSEGVRLGRQLQRDDDNERLSRYKTRIRAQAVKYEEEVLLRQKYHKEMELLQSELFALKDELIAVHTVYEELALSVTTSNPSLESGSHLGPSSTNRPERYDDAIESVSQSLWDTEEDFHALQQMQFMEHEIDSDQLVDDADRCGFENYVICVFVYV